MILGNATLQVGLFCVVGLLNTLIDFAIYNVLARPPFRLSRIKSNLVSTTMAMGFSFTVNLVFVFSPLHTMLQSRVPKFFVVTLISLYGLQTAVIYLLSQVYTVPARLALKCARRFHFTQSVPDDLIVRNAVKLFATIASLIWNFVWYKYYVYAN